MARKAGHVRRHAVILKVLRRNMAWVVHKETSTVGFHGVAGDAESRLFGTLHVRVYTPDDAESGKNAQADEGQDLPGRTCGDGGTNQEDGGEHNAQDNLTDENPDHTASFRYLDDSRRCFGARRGARYFFFPSSRM